MNRLHRWLCRSEHWRRELEIDVLPWVLEEASLGSKVVEANPWRFRFRARRAGDRPLGVN
jgi:hypothetical protein